LFCIEGLWVLPHNAALYNRRADDDALMIDNDMFKYAIKRLALLPFYSPFIEEEATASDVGTSFPDNWCVALRRTSLVVGWMRHAAGMENVPKSIAHYSDSDSTLQVSIVVIRAGASIANTDISAPSSSCCNSISRTGIVPSFKGLPEARPHC
jgi:hypothetical protein